MNLLAYHSERLEAQIREAEKLSPKEIDAQAAELFSEFGFDPEEMRRSLAESCYQEFVETRDADFAAEYDKFTDRDLYTRSLFPFMREGPNCYAFAFQWDKNPRTGDIFRSRPIPGEIAHGVDSDSVTYSRVMQFGSEQEIKDYLEGKIHEDLESAGLEMKEVTSVDHPLKEGEWMIAMVSGKDVYGSPDFHFYRKGDAGTWFHKQGTLPPTMLDEAGKEIFDPKKCDRGPYDAFHGYYVVRPAAQRA